MRDLSLTSVFRLIPVLAVALFASGCDPTYSCIVLRQHDIGAIPAVIDKIKKAEDLDSNRRLCHGPGGVVVNKNAHPTYIVGQFNLLDDSRTLDQQAEIMESWEKCTDLNCLLDFSYDNYEFRTTGDEEEQVREILKQRRPIYAMHAKLREYHRAAKEFCAVVDQLPDPRTPAPLGVGKSLIPAFASRRLQLIKALQALDDHVANLKDKDALKRSACDLEPISRAPAAKPSRKVSRGLQKGAPESHPESKAPRTTGGMHAGGAP